METLSWPGNSRVPPTIGLLWLSIRTLTQRLQVQIPHNSVWQTSTLTTELKEVRQFGLCYGVHQLQRLLQYTALYSIITMQQFNLKQVMQSSCPTRLSTQTGKGHLTQHLTLVNIEWQSRSSSNHQKNETIFYLQTKNENM